MLKASNLDQFKPINPYKGAKTLKDSAPAAEAAKDGAKEVPKDLPKDANAVKPEAYDVKLSEEAKSKSLETSKSEFKTPDLKTPKLDSPDFKPKPTDALSLQSLKEGKKDEVKDTRKTTALEAEKRGTVKKPGIFFIPGAEIFSNASSGRYDGIRKMAEAIMGARVYGWDQKDEIIKEISKLHIDQPIVLVGHSFGGDTAHEVVEALNEVEHGFRKVDLLITIDSVGANNDVIPQNVKRNLNYFGEKDLLLNDGPHVPRDSDRTTIRNVLRPEAHTDLDDTKEVQIEIIESIQEVLRNKPADVAKASMAKEIAKFEAESKI